MSPATSAPPTLIAQFFGASLVAHLVLGGALVFADEVPAPAVSEQRFAEVANSLCFKQVTGAISFGVGITADTLLMNEAGLMFGVPAGTVERMGSTGVGLISQAILGGQQLEDDVVVVAVGGQIPGCRTILVSKNASGTGENAAAMLAASGWTEVPAANTPDAVLRRRMFVRRDAAGQPFLLSLYAGKMPDNDMQLVSTMWFVPENVSLPEGF